MKLKKIISMLSMTALSAALLIGCSEKQEDNQLKEPTKQIDVKVVAPDGLPSIAISKLAKEEINILDGYNITYSVEKTPENLSTTVMKQEPDIAIVPSNMAAIAYNKTSNYQVAGTVGMGSFYLVSTEDISDIKDLEGKEVGNTGKGLTPDITVQTVLTENGIKSESVNFTYVNSANELIPLMATGKINTGFVPEPGLTALMTKNPNIKVVKSLNELWMDSMDSKNGYPQSTIIIKSDFIKENKEFVNSFLSELSDSIEWLNENPKEAGEYSSEIGVSTDAKIIEMAMDRSNLKFIHIKDMKDDYINYYEKLFSFDAKTVGGQLPDEGIYFTEE